MAVPAGDRLLGRDFVLLMAGQAVSLAGSSMTTLALVMLGYAITGSSALAGAVSAVYGVAMAVAMLPAGAIVDRTDRRRTMVVTAAAGAAVLASVPVAGLVGAVGYPHLLVVAGLVGVVTCFYGPAETAAFKALVPPGRLGAAMAAHQARGGVASLVGPPAAGLLYGLGRTVPFLVDAVSFLVAGVCTALVRRPLPAPPAAAGAGRRHLLREVAEGLRWLRRARAVRDLVAASMVANIAFTGAATSVLLSLQQAGAAPARLGLLQAGYGLAGVAGAALAPVVVRRLRVGVVVRLVFWVLVAVDLAAARDGSIGWMGACVAVGYLVVASSNTAMSAYQVGVTPDAVLGRVESAAAFGRVVMIPLGSAAAGLLVETAGRTAALTVFASLMAAAAGMVTTSRAIRTLPLAGRAAAPAPAPAPAEAA